MAEEEGFPARGGCASGARLGRRTPAAQNAIELGSSFAPLQRNFSGSCFPVRRVLLEVHQFPGPARFRGLHSALIVLLQPGTEIAGGTDVAFPGDKTSQHIHGEHGGVRTKEGFGTNAGRIRAQFWRSHAPHGSWRRRRDSNPRPDCSGNGFQDRRLQPLGHSSAISAHFIAGIGGVLGFIRVLHPGPSVSGRGGDRKGCRPSSLSVLYSANPRAGSPRPRSAAPGSGTRRPRAGRVPTNRPGTPRGTPVLPVWRG